MQVCVMIMSVVGDYIGIEEEEQNTQTDKINCFISGEKMGVATLSGVALFTPWPLKGLLGVLSTLILLYT